MDIKSLIIKINFFVIMIGLVVGMWFEEGY